MKKLAAAGLGLCLATITMATALYTIWNRFSPTAIIGSTIACEEMSLQEVSEVWFHDFFTQYEGIFVPFDYRILEKEIDSIEVLDQQKGFVQIDYRVKPASNNSLSQAYYSVILEEDDYLVQIVLQFEKCLEGYRVIDKMRPVEYQIKTDPSLFTPQTQHYAMADVDETYFFDQQKLYVTYDHGVHKMEVPIAYEDIASTNNAQYNEALGAHSYIIDKAFTAFVAYDEKGSYLMYSENQGSTWQTSRIYANRYHSESIYLSKTNTGCYVSIAIDRSLGHEYYTTFKTSDFQTWTPLVGEAFTKRVNVFFDDYIGYSHAGMTQDKKIIVYYSGNDGANYQEIHLPIQAVPFMDTTITPFVEMEYVYKENGKTYIVVGQGSNGDYMKNNHFMMGLYVSDDGINFRFDKEIEADSLTLAG